MAWSVKELVLWLNEVEPVADSRGKFDWLEIPPTASSTAIQEAYHHVARTRHPDLFRSLDPKTLDRLVRMYGRITAAYADLKEPEKCAAYLRELRGPKPQSIPPPPRTGVPVAPPTRAAPITTPPATAGDPYPTPPKPGHVTQPIPRVQRDGPIDPASAMNPRALAFYRRAEGAQRTGDKAAALLQIKMAIAADPKSTFLRAALAELTKS
ncbi:MAG TPA: DnaJ domain-containing protein [Kofleriaceae bacterium]|nr:DnaJ domain-containing protein [Kofleriaceae bacterium]